MSRDKDFEQPEFLNRELVIRGHNTILFDRLQGNRYCVLNGGDKSRDVI